MVLKFAHITDCRYLYCVKEQVLDITSTLKAINRKVDSFAKQLDTALGGIIESKKKNAA
jgi:hypothetical protein